MTEDQQQILLKVLNGPNALKHLKQEFDRSFDISIDEKDGKIKITFAEKDSGHDIMTVADVAAYLQTDRASVRRMTGERAQHRSHHPIPFVKIGGKMLRFSRPAITAWWNELCASKNGKTNTSALSLPKGRTKR
ncbi:MAG: helix-turn-helix domain-containing protein [Candidatus Sulfotelmatobacter sp.]